MRRQKQSSLSIAHHTPPLDYQVCPQKRHRRNTDDAIMVNNYLAPGLMTGRQPLHSQDDTFRDFYYPSECVDSFLDLNVLPRNHFN